MLFNSFPFLFVFLPMALGGTLLLLRGGKVAAGVWFVGFCSLVFYAYWNPLHLLVLIPSITINYLLGRAIIAAADEERRKALMILGIVLNLGALCYFKYTGFILNTFTSSDLNQFTSAIVNTALPIGISFYTFLQIAFLIDCRAAPQHSDYRFRDYLFFVSFFPHLIAGPILHHASIIPQIGLMSRRLSSPAYVTVFFTPGLALFALGIIKKVLIADVFGGYADQSFNSVHAGGLFTFLDAWGGASAYTFQIYFDFSAYSDMAIGLGLMFGIYLPQNFLSPYKATSVIDFWRRWHVTLSRFLRDYLYIPLGGNRKGPVRTYMNIMVTMLLGGLWHGASWSFVFWGGLHGGLLVANHLIREVMDYRPNRIMATAVTFVIIVFTWVPFRATHVGDVRIFYEYMIGLHGIVVPWQYAGIVERIGGLADILGLRAGDVNYFSGMRQLLFTAIGAAIVFFAPNGVEFVSKLNRARHARTSTMVPIGLGVGLLIAMIVMFVTTNETFLYFQF